MHCRIWTVMLLCLLALPLWSQEKRVTIELKDAPIVEAFDQLFRTAGENFVLEPGVPTERRLTMRLVDIPFEKALNFLCDLAGLRWEKKNGVYVISAKTRFFTFPPLGIPPEMPTPVPLMPEMPAPAPPMVGAIGGLVPTTGGFFIGPMSAGAMGMVELFRPLEQRCPKCRTVIRRDCPKCKRPMPRDWRFCPYDGKDLPPVPQKCPKCGAELVPMKPSSPPARKFEIEPPAVLPRIFGFSELVGSYYLRFTDDDAILFVVPKEEVTVQVLEDGKVLAERKLPPKDNLLRLSEILGKKPVPAGTYRIHIIKKGQKIAELTFVVRR
ncbi:MAG: double zinc ribbon domain-containing protein [Armatimonadota bacterium]